MITRILLIVSAIFLVGFLFSWESPLWPDEKPKGTQNLQKEIEGTWTEICTEGNRRMISMLPTFTRPGDWFDETYFLWKISKEIIEQGPDNWRFPTRKFAYKLNPDNKVGAIDLMLLQKGDKPLKDDKGVKIIWKSIYFLKDDFLIICSSSKERPEKFLLNQNFSSLTILHRGNLKNELTEKKP